MQHGVAVVSDARTSLVFPEIHRLLQVQLIAVYLCVEAVVLLQDHGEVSRTQVDATPGSNGLTCVDHLLHIFDMLLAKALNRFTLDHVSACTLIGGRMEKGEETAVGNIP